VANGQPVWERYGNGKATPTQPSASEYLRRSCALFALFAELKHLPRLQLQVGRTVDLHCPSNGWFVYPQPAFPLPFVRKVLIISYP
jgi:hypothetical protein